MLPAGHGPVMTMSMALLGRGGSTVAPLVSSLSTRTPVVLSRSMRSLAAVSTHNVWPSDLHQKDLPKESTITQNFVKILPKLINCALKNT